MKLPGFGRLGIDDGTAVAAPAQIDVELRALAKLCVSHPRYHSASAKCGAMARLSIIIPVLDEGEGIAAALDALSPLRALGVEVIVVDGGSHDATVQRARLRADHVLKASRGRALQMNAGAENRRGRCAAVPARRTRGCPTLPIILCSTGSHGPTASGAVSMSRSERPRLVSRLHRGFS